jgi:hypothetical protein
VLRKRVAVLVAAAVMVLSMFAASAPAALAQPEGCPGGEMQPGQTSFKARAPQSTPSENKPGSARRAESGDVHDTSDDQTGRGEMCGGTTTE